MLFGYPVEKLCTYQYSLVSLIPGTFSPFSPPPFLSCPILHPLRKKKQTFQLISLLKINRTPLKSTRFWITRLGTKEE